MQDCMAWRLNKAKLSWVRAHTDMTNAFMCVAHEKLDEATQDILREQDQAYAAQIYREASVYMPCFDGDLDVHPESVGLMGHSVICKLFARSYKWPHSSMAGGASQVGWFCSAS